MKKLILTMVFALGAALLAGQARAVDFPVSAIIPEATTASFNVTKVMGDGSDPLDWIAQVPGYTDLDFGTLTLDTDNSIFLAAHYWVIDVGVVDGAGTPDVTTTYTEGNNPNAPDPGLGGHGVISFTRIEGSGLSETQTPLLSQDFAGCVGVVCNIDETDIQGGFLRIALGIATGDPLLDEDDALPFTTADAPSADALDAYEGSFTITAVFD